MAFYRCTYTVQSSEVDLGEIFVTTIVKDSDAESEEGVVAEGEWWLFNPVISVDLDGADSIDFDNGGEGVRPGTVVYSDPFQVKNGADDGSNVYLDMFVFGSDFTGSGNCPDSNKLSLTNFDYRATHGAYRTHDDA